ncbi:hypothetical protein BDN71DRAFT_1514679 [Pleurotus eryngii]|uniref:Uncharacterized protein n=1 Tax=Pleurotus eryngii TaxID=5323 RepID=A0A9P5ZFZ3_PLEER|nr:hypothetical protein BDN71DRAFT_1514679 [Pleurotus eryngii]
MQPEPESNSELSDLTESEGEANLSVLVQDTDCVAFKKKLGKKYTKLTKAYIMEISWFTKRDTIDLRRVHELPQSKFDIDLQGGRFTRFECDSALRAEYPDFVYEREIFDKGVTVDVILFLQSYLAPALLPIIRKQVQIVDAHRKTLNPMTRSPYYKDECAGR